LTRALIAAALVLVPASAEPETVRYALTVEATFATSEFLGFEPPADSHFSWLGGATHDGTADFWSVGAPLSRGLVLMAEWGDTRQFIEEDVAAAEAAGSAGSALHWQRWFCPDGVGAPQCGASNRVEFETTDSHPLVTLVSMIGPSPDWFVGVDGLSLRQDGAWVEEIVVDLFTYDGGSQDANQLAMTFDIPGAEFTGTGYYDPDDLDTAKLASLDPVRLTTADQVITDGRVGTFTFELIATPLPASLWLMLAGLAAIGLRRRVG